MGDTKGCLASEATRRSKSAKTRAFPNLGSFSVSTSLPSTHTATRESQISNHACPELFRKTKKRKKTTKKKRKKKKKKQSREKKEKEEKKEKTEKTEKKEKKEKNEKTEEKGREMNRKEEKGRERNEEHEGETRHNMIFVQS